MDNNIFNFENVYLSTDYVLMPLKALKGYNIIKIAFHYIKFDKVVIFN